MKESILLIILSLVTFIFFFLNKTQVTYVVSEYDNKEYLVNNDENKNEAANLLSQISERLFKLRDYLSDNIVRFPKYEFKYANRINIKVDLINTLYLNTAIIENE